MRIYLFLSTVLFCVAISGCASKAVPVEFSKACDVENDRKNIELIGFFDAKGDIVCSNIGGGAVTCNYDFKDAIASDKTITSYIEKGRSANQVETQEKLFKRENVKIHDNSGNIIGLDEKVKITGLLRSMKDTDIKGNPHVSCLLTVSKIEK